MYTLYKVENKKNGKVYIGQTTRPFSERKNEYRSMYNKRAGNSRIHGAILKYGLDAFSFDVVEEVPEDVVLLNDREEFWIAYFGSTDPQKGYNIDLGGRNHIRSEETKRKMSEAKKGKAVSSNSLKNLELGRKLPRKQISEGTRNKMSDAKRGKPISAGSLLSLSKWWGKTTYERTPEIKEKMSLAHKGIRPEKSIQKLKEWHERNSTKLINTEGIIVFESMVDLSKKRNLSLGFIRNALKTKGKIVVDNEVLVASKKVK